MACTIAPFCPASYFLLPPGMREMRIFSSLISQKKQTLADGSTAISRTMLNVWSPINARFSLPRLSLIWSICPLEDFVAKLRQWRRHFHRFFYLITHPHVDYIYHFVNALPQAMKLVWVELSEVCLKVLYYRLAGEKNWPILCPMFRALIYPYRGRAPAPSL